MTVVVAALKDDMAMTDLSMNPEGSGDGNGGTAMAGRVQMSLYGLDGAPIVAACHAKELQIPPFLMEENQEKWDVFPMAMLV